MNSSKSLKNVRTPFKSKFSLLNRSKAKRPFSYKKNLTGSNKKSVKSIKLKKKVKKKKNEVKKLKIVLKDNRIFTSPSIKQKTFQLQKINAEDLFQKTSSNFKDLKDEIMKLEFKCNSIGKRNLESRLKQSQLLSQNKLIDDLKKRNTDLIHKIGVFSDSEKITLIRIEEIKKENKNLGDKYQRLLQSKNLSDQRLMAFEYKNTEFEAVLHKKSNDIDFLKNELNKTKSLLLDKEYEINQKIKSISNEKQSKLQFMKEMRNAYESLKFEKENNIKIKNEGMQLLGLVETLKEEIENLKVKNAETINILLN